MNKCPLVTKTETNLNAISAYLVNNAFLNVKQCLCYINKITIPLAVKKNIFVHYIGDACGQCYKTFLHLSGAPLYGRLLALPANIRLGWKSLAGTNAPTNYEKA